MLAKQASDPWPRMRAVVTAVVTGLHNGHFIEEALDSLCSALGATVAYAKVGRGDQGQLFRSGMRASTVFAARGQSVEAEEALGRTVRERRVVQGSLPNGGGHFICIPLRSNPATPRFPSASVGALYLEFSEGAASEPAVVEFVKSVALLLGGITQQLALFDATREDLRATRAKEPARERLELNDLISTTSMRSIRDEVMSALAGNSSIMILGESGTGKTQLATALARHSDRVPIVRATLGLSDDLNTITSELFGHERGAFSGAVSKRKGLVEYADGGTLILDEVLNLPAHAQQLLLDFTQFGTYRPLGFEGREPKRATVRLISVTNGNISQAIVDTRFRQDLYFRLATVPIIMPPLRERRQDIPGLAVRYLQRSDPQNDWSLEADAIAILCSPQLEWAGNIRELEGVLERAKNRALASDDQSRSIRPSHLNLGAGLEPANLDADGVAEVDAAEPLVDRWSRLGEERAALDELERKIIEEALGLSNGVVAHTARELNVSRTGLISRMSTLNIDARQFKVRAG